MVFNFHLLFFSQACSGKFMPVMQWMYFDSLESLKEEDRDETPENYQPRNSRYDAQIAVFGKDFQKKLNSSKYFVVRNAFASPSNPFSAKPCLLELLIKQTVGKIKITVKHKQRVTKHFNNSIIFCQASNILH